MNNNLILRALELGATDFDISEKKDKQFYVVYNGKKYILERKTERLLSTIRTKPKMIIGMPAIAK